MKLKYLFFLFFLSACAFAQTPAYINYQGVARASDGSAIVNQSIRLKFDLHQGSATATVVFTEQQALSTNSLGLFSTQIGKVNTTGLSLVDWQAGPFYLEISLDETGSSSFTSLGTQQLASVPFAMHASSVPATFSNNVLSIGNKTFVLTQTVAVVPNTSITVSGLGTVTTVGTNTFDINIPAPNFTGQGSTTVTGVYPNYTVNTQVASAPTITGAGISTVTSSGNSYTMNVATPTLTGLGTNTVTGSYPNFSINSAAPVLTGLGTNTVTGSYPNYSINSTAPVLTGLGSILITGTYPNYTINSPTVAAPITPTIVGAGLANVSPTVGNSFVVTVPQPTFAYTQTTGSLTSGTTSVYVTPNLSYSNGVISAGPSSNSIALNSGTNAVWSTLGNIATNSVTNFIGTTDNVPLVFKVNNQKAGLIDIVQQNTFFGLFSGNVNTANNNTGFGHSALIANTTGVLNTAIGHQALLSNTAGGSNTGIGRQALYSNVAGSLNTALGREAGYSSLGTGNVYLGYQAGYYETGSNKLYISNSSTSVTPLVYGDFANGKLSINTTTNNFGVLSVDNNSVTSRDGIHLYNGRDAIGAGIPLSLEITTAGQTYGTTTQGRIIRLANTTSGQMYDMGFGSANNFYITAANNYAPATFNISTTGNVGINTAAANGNFHVHSTQSSVLSRITSTAATTGLITYIDGSSASLLNYENTPLFFGTNGANRMVIGNTGMVGIGTSAPTATLHVNGTMRLVDGTQAAGRVLTSDASGNASWQIDQGWGTLGTAGTNASTNFMGTTDNQDVVFKSNNSEVFRAKTTGVIAMPEGATRVITVGQRTSNVTGSALQLKGGNAGTGGFAVDGGDLILEGGDGYNISVNSAIGGNVVLRTGKNIYGSSIYNSGEIIFQNVNSSNTYYEMARFNGAGLLGIGTSAPTATLHVSGSTRLSDGSEGADKVLRSDAAGNATWANSSINTGFMAYATTAQNISSSTTSSINFNVESFDDGSDFSSGAYTCPTAGVYHFESGVSWNGFASVTNWTHIFIYRNAGIEAIRMVPPSTGFFSNLITATIKCNAGDVITVRVLQQSGAAQPVFVTANYTYFSGYRVY